MIHIKHPLFYTFEIRGVFVLLVVAHKKLKQNKEYITTGREMGGYPVQSTCSEA